MSNMSDMIQEFILQILEENDMVQLSRNELASYFNVSPSQINYVLSTRFTLDSGYVVESKRGGGGFINLHRIKSDKEDLLSALLAEISSGIDFTQKRAEQIIARLLRDGVIDKKESLLIKAAISDKAINVPLQLKDRVRGGIFKEIIITLLK